MDKNFYKAFEDKYRGSRDLIKSRLKVYLPFVVPLLKIYPEARAVDLGCGRGEWLELMLENGFQATGVDIDEEMLVESKKIGLNVACKNAIEYLNSLPENSQVVVSAMHFVEHISFANLQELVRSAFLVLKPGGLLIMETPNPENIVVGSSSFYLDPTHNRPIHPNLLSFLPEYYGFKNTKVIRLQESKHIKSKMRLSILDVLNGVSPDYAVIAQKNADYKVLSLNSDAFAKNYGLTLENLAANYQRIVNAEWVKNKFKLIKKVFAS